MAFPLPNEYNEAIQNLRSTMSDDEIRQGEAAVSAPGLAHAVLRQLRRCL